VQVHRSKSQSPLNSQRALRHGSTTGTDEIPVYTELVNELGVSIYLLVETHPHLLDVAVLSS